MAPRQANSGATVWRELLAIARWTPSPHNTQPWFVSVHDAEHARLLLDHRRALPKEDLTGCFIGCAMGSFIESLRLLAANRGYRLITTPLVEARDGDMEPFAELALVRDESVKRECEDELFIRRQTSRLAPEPEVLTPAEVARLQTVASEYGQTLNHYTERPTIDRLMHFNLDAVIEDLNSREYHDEIVSWFRFRERTAKQRADGLSARCMTIPPIEFFLFSHCPWCVRLPIVGGFARRRYAQRIGPVPQLAALAGPFWDRTSATKAGACLMRLWLEMTRFNLYIHPFGNLVTNERARCGMTELTGCNDIWIVFRLGRTAPPPRSHRLSIEEISDA